jgi:8-oxo-dGTP pyrophosphatase MutT (NUDIX family)
MTGLKLIRPTYVGAGIVLVSPCRTRYLLLKGHSGIWSFPKGHTEFSDKNTPLRTACRETYEETGFIAGTDYTIVGDFIRFGKRPYWVGIMRQDTVPCIAEREHSEAAWLTAEDIGAMTINSDVRDWTKKIGRGFKQLASAQLQS